MKGKDIYKIFEYNEKNIDIIKLVDELNKIFIKFSSSRKKLKIESKSIKKIFSFIICKDHLLDVIYSENIIYNIKGSSTKNKENKNFEKYELDKRYKKVLDNSFLFWINIKKRKPKYKDDTDNKIKIMRKSLIKIFTYLDESIFSMSDYILIIVLLIKEEQNNIFNSNFNQIKLFEIYNEIPNKNSEQDIYKYDLLFTNVLNYLYDYENEPSISDDLINLAIPKKKIDKELIKDNITSSKIESIITEDNNNKTNENNNLNNININNENKNKKMCNDICIVF